MSSSVASINFFAALQEEQPAETFTKPVDKKTTSSKKTDKAPAKADPARARPKKTETEGNNAAFKDKTAGRTGNKKVNVGESATAHAHRAGREGKFDRRDKTGKQDTGKRVRQGWGDNKKELQDEQAAEQIASEDKAADAAEDEAAEAAARANFQTLDQFLASKADSSLNLRTARPKRTANEGADNAQWANAQVVKKPEETEVARKKNLRQKNRKEIETLEPDAKFLPSLIKRDAPRRESREPRDARGPKPGRGPRSGDRSERSERGDRKAKPAKQASKPNLENLPKLG